MPKRRGEAEAKNLATDSCQYCKGRKGRNLEIVHLLKFRDSSELGAHLGEVFPSSDYCVEWFLTFWHMAHQIYSQRAYELKQPLWLVYLEAHGVTVNNRGDAIVRHRQQHGQGEMAL